MYFTNKHISPASKRVQAQLCCKHKQIQLKCIMFLFRKILKPNHCPTIFDGSTERHCPNSKFPIMYFDSILPCNLRPYNRTTKITTPKVAQIPIMYFGDIISSWITHKHTNWLNCRSQIGLPNIATYTITLAFHSKRMTRIIRIPRMNSAFFPEFEEFDSSHRQVYHPSL